MWIAFNASPRYTFNQLISHLLHVRQDWRQLRHPEVPDYDAILNGSDTKDIKLYRQGDGILTQGKHRMIFFSSNELHGQTRYYQGSCAPNPDSVPDITTYLTHGSPSTGVLGLGSNQYTVIKESPYMQTADDRRGSCLHPAAGQ
jgi:cellobiose dehydrogenase (acceptor)